jgi:hypothetical protein
MCRLDRNRSLRTLGGLGLAGLACWTLAAFGAPSARGEEDAAGGAGAGEERILRQRVASYWDARVARAANVFDFYAPADKGGPQKAGEVSEGGNIIFKSYEIKDIEIDGDSALVHLYVSADIHLDRPSSAAQLQRDAQIHEAWVYVDSTWYKRPVPPGLSRHMRRRPTAAEATADQNATPHAGGAQP